MAVKYQGGVICCADSSNFYSNSQEHLLVESTLLTELPTRSTTFTTTSACSGVEPPVNPSKPPTRCDISSTLTASSKENSPTSWPPPECSKRSITKNSWAQVTSSPAGIHTKALKFTQLIWEERPSSGTLRWEDQEVGLFTDIATRTTSRTWLLRRRRTSASVQCLWLWRGMGALEVLSDWRISLRRDWRRSTTLMKVFHTSHFDWCIDLMRFNDILVDRSIYLGWWIKILARLCFWIRLMFLRFR